MFSLLHSHGTNFGAIARNYKLQPIRWKSETKFQTLVRHGVLRSSNKIYVKKNNKVSKQVRFPACRLGIATSLQVNPPQQLCWPAPLEPYTTWRIYKFSVCIGAASKPQRGSRFLGLLHGAAGSQQTKSFHGNPWAKSRQQPEAESSHTKMVCNLRSESPVCA